MASFFVSRVDAVVDSLLEERMRSNSQAAAQAAYRSLLGQIAVANAKCAYQKLRLKFNSQRFHRLEQKGARVQKLLWASTSTKNPQYKDVLYVEELIGSSTINTMPQVTLQAFRDHGTIRESLMENVREAKQKIDKLANYQIDLRTITQELERKGVSAFLDSYRRLLKIVESKRGKVLIS